MLLTNQRLSKIQIQAFSGMCVTYELIQGKSLDPLIRVQCANSAMNITNKY